VTTIAAAVPIRFATLSRFLFACRMTSTPLVVAVSPRRQEPGPWTRVYPRV